MFPTQLRRDTGRKGHGRRDNTKRQLAIQIISERVDLLSHTLGVSQKFAGPFQRNFTLARETQKAIAPAHKRQFESLLQLANSGRECGLGNIAIRRRMRKIFMSRQRHQKF